HRGPAQRISQHPRGADRRRARRAPQAPERGAPQAGPLPADPGRPRSGRGAPAELGGGARLDLEPGDVLERPEALVDLVPGQPLDALRAEILDVERGEHGPIRHRLAEDLRVGRRLPRGTAPVEVAEEAPGEAVAGAGRVTDVLQEVAGDRKELVSRE